TRTTGERQHDGGRKQPTRHVQAHPTSRKPAPGSGVGNIRRIGKPAGDAKRLGYPFLRADGRLPIISARTGRYFSWVEEIAHTEIKIDISYCLANSAAYGDFGSGLGWQLDARHRSASIELAKCCFDGGADGRLMVGQRWARVRVVG